MRNCGNIISKEIDRQGVVKKTFANAVGITPQNLNKYLLKPSFDSALLERCCEFLGLDPAAFFDYRPGLLAPKYQIGNIENRTGLGLASIEIGTDSKLVKMLIDEKDARIKTLEDTVKTLRSLLVKNKIIENISDNNSADA